MITRIFIRFMGFVLTLKRAFIVRRMAQEPLDARGAGEETFGRDSAILERFKVRVNRRLKQPPVEPIGSTPEMDRLRANICKRWAKERRDRFGRSLFPVLLLLLALPAFGQEEDIAATTKQMIRKCIEAGIALRSRSGEGA